MKVAPSVRMSRSEGLLHGFLERNVCVEKKLTLKIKST